MFKIESVGELYVAVSGLPNPEKRHAVIMAQFAQDCRTKMKKLVLGLERRLGPGTGDLRLKIGLNSGATTGGVLRSEKSIFQIFGDTVNVAARMQRTALEDRIQASQKTANELIHAGREHWVKPRTEALITMYSDNDHPDDDAGTFWVEPPFEMVLPPGSNSSSISSEPDSDDFYCFTEQLPVPIQRLVAWNLDQLDNILVNLMAQSSSNPGTTEVQLFEGSKYPRSERSETVFLKDSESHSSTARFMQSSSDLPVLDNSIRNLLNDFISSIAFMYQEGKHNQYHDFEHSANAAMSIMKFLSSLSLTAKPEMAKEENDPDIRITYIHLVLSDPMVQFSMIFSALIHGVAHPGLSNRQLVRQNAPAAKRYKGKNVTEQCSIDMAWELFMDPGYNELRAVIFRKPSDILEFRKLIINAVLATDLDDLELMKSRDSRWNDLFETNKGDPRDVNSGSYIGKNEEYNNNRRAALVIEYIIQASVISEFMQHWNTYEKRRRRYFNETMKAKAVVSMDDEADPSTTWYEKELAFFDEFVIPLLEKIKMSGVFGSSCEEMFEYALSNRQTWESKGADLVERWKQEMLSKSDDL